MNFRYELRGRLRHAAIPLLCACGVAYFGYHAVQGDNGLVTYFRVGQQNTVLAAERDRQVDARVALEHRVAALRSSSLDLDLLDERARNSLGVAHPRDRVILLD